MSHEILIIDDSVEDLHLLDNILVEAGYRVRVARNGQSGVMSAQYTPPDVILIDLILPDESGFLVCKRLMEVKSLEHIPILFVSGVDDVDLKARAFDVGASDYITKPFNKKEILVRIDHQLERVFLTKQITELTRKQEREHIVRELHDSLKDSLFGIGALTQSLLFHADDYPASTVEVIQHIRRLAETASAEVRTLLTEMRSSYLNEMSLPQLFEQLVLASRMRLAARIDLFVNIQGDLPLEKKLMFYRIGQEALTNIIKHADARVVRIELSYQAGRYRLVVEDDGRGFDVQHQTWGIGIQSMRDRADEEGADFTITSADGAGTRIEVTFDEKRLRTDD